MQILPQFLQMNRITHLALFSRTFVFLYNYTLQKYIIKGETYLFPLQSLPLSTFKLLNSVRENKKCLLPRDCTATAQPFFCLTHPKSNHQHCESTWESPSSLKAVPPSPLELPRCGWALAADANLYYPGHCICPTDQNWLPACPPAPPKRKGGEGCGSLPAHGSLLCLPRTHDWWHLYPYPSYSLLTLHPTSSSLNLDSLGEQGTRVLVLLCNSEWSF